MPSEAREAAEDSRPPSPHAPVMFPRPGDLTMAGRAGDSLVALTVRPGRPGSNRLYAYVAATPAVTAAVSAVIGGATRELTACGSSCWTTRVDFAGGEQIGIRVPGFHGGTVGFALPSLPAADASGLVTSASAWMSALRSYQVDEMFSGIHSTYAFAVPHQMWLRMWLSGTPRESLWLGTSLYKRSSPTAPWSAPASAEPVPVPYVAWKPFGPAVDATVIGGATLEWRPGSEGVVLRRAWNRPGAGLVYPLAGHVRSGAALADVGAEPFHGRSLLRVQPAGEPAAPAGCVTGAAARPASNRRRRMPGCTIGAGRARDVRGDASAGGLPGRRGDHGGICRDRCRVVRGGRPRRASGQP